MKKIQALILTFLAFVLVACGNSGANTSADKPLLIGMEAGYPPYNWTQKDDSNDAVPIQGTNSFANGYDVQIARKIGEALGRKVEVVKTEWDGLVPALQAGKVDLIIAGMSPTAERAKVVDFTDAYYASQFVLVMRKDSPFASATKLTDFADAKVTGQLGTLHYDLLNQLVGATVEQAQKSFPVMRVALESGKIDAYISEVPEAQSATAANNQFTYIELPFEVADEDKLLAIGVKKGSDLTAQVNEALKAISQAERDKMMEEAIKNQPASE
ncbi:transporter substrate-binding domain-containing protein [Aerococcaceae bacterium NML201209]|nr:transporter substrate-binding domain-containing protein [Aerococcaceae bacterium NML201209]MCW6665185.1 transporter substrate-binding domain-containing protein [Aerococcaceae bacterium NML191219]